MSEPDLNPIDYPHEFPLVAQRHPVKARRAAAERDPDLEQTALVDLGFCWDTWIPIEVASRWNSPVYPVVNTPEAVEQFRGYLRHCISLALGAATRSSSKKQAKKHKTLAGRLRRRMRNDLALIRQYDAEKTATSESTPPEQVEGAGADEWMWEPDGNGYRVAGLGERGHLSGLRGLAMVEKLLGCPGQPVPMVLLVGEATERLNNDKRTEQPAMDSEALQEAFKDWDTLRAEIAQDEAEGRTLEAAESREKLEKLHSQLNAAVGIRGKVRDLNKLADKLRPTISSNLSRVYKAMRGAKPPMLKLAYYLEGAIGAEGASFVYKPALISSPSWKTSTSVAPGATK
jgi:hypothetical protein